MSWDWLGRLSWIRAIAFFCYVIHYIRVKQLILITKAKKVFKLDLLIHYVILLVVSLCWLGGMSYLTLFHSVDINNHQQTQTSTTYRPLQVGNKSDDFYYASATHSKSGRHPIVSCTYWAENDKYATNSRYGLVADGSRIVTLDAGALPWDRKQSEKEDAKTGHAFAAVMDVKYKNTAIDGLGLKANYSAATYTLLRVSSSDTVSER